MQLKKIIADNGFKFKKSLGQNFIEDDNILSAIVGAGDITENDTVLEIGAGGGTLTKALSDRAKFVYAYEIDRNLAPVLAQTLKGVENAEVIFKDFMRVPMSEAEKDMDGEYVVVANLPYYITTPIVMKLLEEGSLVKRIIVTVQKEVADRLCADASSSDYGAISVAIDLYGSAKKVFDINRDNFYPAPNVDSAVVRIDIDRNKFGSVDHKAFRDTVRAAFSSRRKTLVNNLMMNFKISRDSAESALGDADIDPSVRGEKLNAEQFLRLSVALKERKII